ncbi:hypothetical protein DIPPA_31904 [Diplonema papillatum]|nr:hypothetical protein DIPPA_31904 [Diplonema papillatum]
MTGKIEDVEDKVGEKKERKGRKTAGTKNRRDRRLSQKSSHGATPPESSGPLRDEPGDADRECAALVVRLRARFGPGRQLRPPGHDTLPVDSPAAAARLRTLGRRDQHIKLLIEDVEDKLGEKKERKGRKTAGTKNRRDRRLSQKSSHGATPPESSGPLRDEPGDADRECAALVVRLRARFGPGRQLRPPGHDTLPVDSPAAAARPHLLRTLGRRDQHIKLLQKTRVHKEGVDTHRLRGDGGTCPENTAGKIEDVEVKLGEKKERKGRKTAGTKNRRDRRLSQKSSHGATPPESSGPLRDEPGDADRECAALVVRLRARFGPGRQLRPPGHDTLPVDSPAAAARPHLLRTLGRRDQHIKLLERKHTPHLKRGSGEEGPNQAKQKTRVHKEGVDTHRLRGDGGTCPENTAGKIEDVEDKLSEKKERKGRKRAGTKNRRDRRLSQKSSHGATPPESSGPLRDEPGTPTESALHSSYDSGHASDLADSFARQDTLPVDSPAAPRQGRVTPPPGAPSILVQSTTPPSDKPTPPVRPLSGQSPVLNPLRLAAPPVVECDASSTKSAAANENPFRRVLSSSTASSTTSVNLTNSVRISSATNSVTPQPLPADSEAWLDGVQESNGIRRPLLGPAVSAGPVGPGKNAAAPRQPAAGGVPSFLTSHSAQNLPVCPPPPPPPQQTGQNPLGCFHQAPPAGQQRRPSAASQGTAPDCSGGGSRGVFSQNYTFGDSPGEDAQLSKGYSITSTVAGAPGLYPQGESSDEDRDRVVAAASCAPRSMGQPIPPVRQLASIDRRRTRLDDLSCLTSEDLRSFTPQILQKHLNECDAIGFADRQYMAAVLYIDVVGFTGIMERFVRLDNGAEKMSHELNYTFGLILSEIARFKGDTIQFSGDAVMAAWALPMDEMVCRRKDSSAEETGGAAAGATPTSEDAEQPPTDPGAEAAGAVLLRNSASRNNNIYSNSDTDDNNNNNGSNANNSNNNTSNNNNNNNNNGNNTNNANNNNNGNNANNSNNNTNNNSNNNNNNNNNGNNTNSTNNNNNNNNNNNGNTNNNNNNNNNGNNSNNNNSNNNNSNGNNSNNNNNSNSNNTTSNVTSPTASMPPSRQSPASAALSPGGRPGEGPAADAPAPGCSTDGASPPTASLSFFSSDPSGFFASPATHPQSTAPDPSSLVSPSLGTACTPRDELDPAGQDGKPSKLGGKRKVVASSCAKSSGKPSQKALKKIAMLAADCGEAVLRVAGSRTLQLGDQTCELQLHVGLAIGRMDLLVVGSRNRFNSVCVGEAVSKSGRASVLASADQIVTTKDMLAASKGGLSGSPVSGNQEFVLLGKRTPPSSEKIGKRAKLPDPPLLSSIQKFLPTVVLRLLCELKLHTGVPLRPRGESLINGHSHHHHHHHHSHHLPHQQSAGERPSGSSVPSLPPIPTASAWGGQTGAMTSPAGVHPADSTPGDGSRAGTPPPGSTAAKDKRLTAGEVRIISSIFISIDVDFTSPTAASEIDETYSIIQKQLSRARGVCNKLIYDDKGLVCLCVFGLPGMSHEDDASRSVAFARDTFQKIDSERTKCYFGISRSRAYCGICGSQERREYTVLGDGVNLAARLMGQARAQSGQVSSDGDSEDADAESDASGSADRVCLPVVLDEATKDACGAHFAFTEASRVSLKGKDATVKIFRLLTSLNLHSRRSITTSSSVNVRASPSLRRSSSFVSSISTGSLLSRSYSEHSEPRNNQDPRRKPHQQIGAGSASSVGVTPITPLAKSLRNMARVDEGGRRVSMSDSASSVSEGFLNSFSQQPILFPCTTNQGSLLVIGRIEELRVIAVVIERLAEYEQTQRINRGHKRKPPGRKNIAQCNAAAAHDVTDEDSSSEGAVQDYITLANGSDEHGGPYVPPGTGFHRDGSWRSNKTSTSVQKRPRQPAGIDGTRPSPPVSPRDNRAPHAVAGNSNKQQQQQQPAGPRRSPPLSAASPAAPAKAPGCGQLPSSSDASSPSVSCKSVEIPAPQAPAAGVAVDARAGFPAAEDRLQPPPFASDDLQDLPDPPPDPPTDPPPPHQHQPRATVRRGSGAAVGHVPVLWPAASTTTTVPCATGSMHSTASSGVVGGAGLGVSYGGCGGVALGGSTASLAAVTVMPLASNLTAQQGAASTVPHHITRGNSFNTSSAGISSTSNNHNPPPIVSPGEPPAKPSQQPAEPGSTPNPNFAAEAVGPTASTPRLRAKRTNTNSTIEYARPRVVLIEGEAGIGKSLLLHKAAEVAKDKKILHKLVACSLSAQSTPYGAFAGFIEDLLTSNLSATMSLQPIQTRLLAATFPLLAALLSSQAEASEDETPRDSSENEAKDKPGATPPPPAKPAAAKLGGNPVSPPSETDAAPGSDAASPLDGRMSERGASLLNYEISQRTSWSNVASVNDAVRYLFVRKLRGHSMLLIVDDSQWLDDLSWGLVGYLLDEVPTLSIILSKRIRKAPSIASPCRAPPAEPSPTPPPSVAPSVPEDSQSNPSSISASLLQQPVHHARKPSIDDDLEPLMGRSISSEPRERIENVLLFANTKEGEKKPVADKVLLLLLGTALAVGLSREETMLPTLNAVNTYDLVDTFREVTVATPFHFLAGSLLLDVLLKCVGSRDAKVELPVLDDILDRLRVISDCFPIFRTRYLYLKGAVDRANGDMQSVKGAWLEGLRLSQEAENDGDSALCQLGLASLTTTPPPERDVYLAAARGLFVQHRANYLVHKVDKMSPRQGRRTRQTPPATPPINAGT